MHRFQAKLCVMPVKTGIQARLPIQSSIIAWIPAVAGMTNKVDLVEVHHPQL